MSKVIANQLKEGQKLTSRDLIDRGYGEVADFLNSDNSEKFDLIITNPPFKYAQEFVEKGLEKADTVVILAKIQLLEGQSRSKVFSQIGLKEIYGHTTRCNCWRGGEEMNPNTNKPWSGALFMAWFVFEKGYNGRPTYEWMMENN